MFRSPKTLRAFCCLALACGCAGVCGWELQTHATAEEPIQKFLQRLREDRMHDVAIKYLDSAEKRNRIPESFKQNLAFERLNLLQDSLSTIQRPADKEQLLNQVESELRTFISADANHPKHYEALNRLGDLLRERATLLLQEGKNSSDASQAEKLRSSARTGLTEANDLYGRVIQETTPILQSLAGNRAQTPADVQRREQLHTDFRQAEILQAKTLEFLADTYPPGSSDATGWLQKAEERLSTIVDRTTSSTDAGRRFLCLLYRGQVQAKLKKLREARESFTSVADVKESGIFRTWRSEAIAGLIRIDMAETPPKLEAAVTRGADALGTLNAQEKMDPSGIELQLSLLEARMAFSEAQSGSKDTPLYRNNQREARALAQSLVRIQGPHREAALKALSDLGGTQVDTEAIDFAEAKNFQDALRQARTRIERAETTEQTIPSLQQENSPEDGIRQVRESVKNERTLAIETLHRALELFQSSDDAESLLNAKYLLAYLYLKTEQYWDAYAVASAVLEGDKHSENGIKCGGFALISLSKLIDAAPSEQQAFLIPTLERLANLLLEVSPGSDAAKNAVDVLVTLAIREKNYDEASRFIELAGGGSSTGASLLGQNLWRDYQQKVSERRREGHDPSEEDQEILNRAIEFLEKGWNNVTGSTSDKVTIQGILALVSAYLSEDRVEDADKVLNEPNRGAIVLAESTSGIDTRDKLEAYRLQLQTLVQRAGSPSGEPLDSDQVNDLVNQMKEVAGSDEALLGNALRNLAFSISAKISQSKNAADQARVGGALGLLVKQLVNVTDDVAILESAGNSVLALATSLRNVPGLEQQSKELMRVSDAAYSKMAQMPAEELQAANRNPDELQIRIAMAKAGSGQFEAAHKIFKESLAKTPTNVSLQVATARNLQDWGNASEGQTKTERLQNAWAGGEPLASGGNLVWGWNRISQLTASRVKETTFRDIYFDARLQLAACRMSIGLAESDPGARKRELQQAAGIVRQTRIVYPDFGSPEFKSHFEKLDAQIQSHLSK